MDTLWLFVVVGGALVVLIGVPGATVALRRLAEHRRYLRDIDAADPVTIHRPPARPHRRSRLVWGGGRHGV